jgi:hypothetical protein
MQESDQLSSQLLRFKWTSQCCRPPAVSSRKASVGRLGSLAFAMSG